MGDDEQYHPADLRLVRYIRLRKSKEEGNDITIEPYWLSDFQDEVNMPLHHTRIRFGMAVMIPWRYIELAALAPAQFGGMETLCLSVHFEKDMPLYHLEIFDTGMSKRAEYSFGAINDPKYGLLALLEDEYGDRINFDV